MFTNKDLKHLLILLVIEQVLVMLMGMAETMMVSHAGEAAIFGGALVDMLDHFIITVLSSVATGGAVVVSQYLGSRHMKCWNISMTGCPAQALRTAQSFRECLRMHRRENLSI